MLAVRFFLTRTVTWTLTGLSAKPQLAATFLPALSITVISVANLLHLLQVGTTRTKPITAAIMPSLPPLSAYLLLAAGAEDAHQGGPGGVARGG
ncbi:MAG TPA: hypothetical protein VFO01_14665 [Trebonia sp.]|nr:hypothetical protein [Trebonia sp.]